MSDGSNERLASLQFGDEIRYLFTSLYDRQVTEVTGRVVEVFEVDDAGQGMTSRYVRLDSLVCPIRLQSACELTVTRRAS